MISPLRFAHFEVLARSDGSPLYLGQGAMGITYKAFDQNLLSVAVIKVPTALMQNEPAARQRFLQEAQMMARLRHPNVASVFFFGDSPGGAFYAMEFCDGPTLQDYVKDNGVMKWDDAFRLALQAASALQALDTHELVHRDLKPSNIIITRDDAGHANLKLIDFGVAREGLPSDTRGLTQSGFIGTPAYASPEQLLDNASIDSRSDLYALGAVLWFCLTGKPPFEGTQFEVMFKHVKTEPDWSELPEMPVQALGIMKRLLAKFREERYISPSAFLAELKRILGDSTPSFTRIDPAAKLGPIDFGGYEPIAEIGSDSYGKIWRASDILTGRTVALRVFAQEFSSKTALVLRAQRLTAFVRPLEHKRLLRVWHFEQSGTECRLATEWVEGPSLLALLKARKTMPLADVLPIFIQVAEAMDFAAAQGLTSVETAPERLHISVLGWVDMSEDTQTDLLRQAPSEWPEWSVKVCPLRLSLSAQDYVVPTDSEAAQMLTSIASDFIRLCHRLLTGLGSYVPSPLLREKSNVFLEKHYINVGAGVSCRNLLRQLCLAEGMELPVENETALPGAVLTREETPKSGTAHQSVATTTDPTVIVSRSGTVPSPSLSAAAVRLRELEHRRAELDAEAEKLRTVERLRAEQEWLAKERDALEKVRREIAAQEAVSAQRIAEEQVRLAEQRASLDQQQFLLEEKRREQQKLEHEIQLRAQAEFQKMQEEARSHKSQLQHKHIAAEEALRNLEAEFRAREQESLARLETLKREASQMGKRVSLEAQTLRNNELEVIRRQQLEKEDKGLTKDALAAEERRIAQMLADLHARQAQWQGTQNKRNFTLALTALMVLLLAATIAYFMKAQVKIFDELPGAAKWEAAIAERNRSKSEHRWADLLAWCVVIDKTFRAQPEFTETLKKHQSEIEGDAMEAVHELLKSGSLPDSSTEEGRKLLMNVEETMNWNLPVERILLLAKLRMPEAAARGDGINALNVYLKATNANSAFAADLGNNLKLTVDSLRKLLRAGKLEGEDELQKLLREAAKSEARQESSEVVRFIGESLAEQARRSGKPEESLRLLLETAQINPSWAADLRPQAAEVVSQLTKLPIPSILPLAPTLRKAGDTWRLADAYLALAPIEADAEIRFDDYKLADIYGSMKARALVGRILFDTGRSQNKPELTQQGIAKLREAIAAGESEGMVLLGEALYQQVELPQKGMPESASSEIIAKASLQLNEALLLANQANTNGHPEAFYLAARIKLALAMNITHESKQFEEAAALLEKAVSLNLPSATYFLYLCHYNDTVKNLDLAIAALEKGVTAHDANCLYNLGLWLTLGQPPVQLNITRGRAVIQEAASQGNRKAREWLLKFP